MKNKLPKATAFDGSPVDDSGNKHYTVIISEMAAEMLVSHVLLQANAQTAKEAMDMKKERYTIDQLFIETGLGGKVGSGRRGTRQRKRHSYRRGTWGVSGKA